MNCGTNWLVPGANPYAGNTAVNDLMLVGNTETTMISLQSATITPILQIDFTTIANGYIVVNGNATVKSLVNPQHNISYYCELDGVMIHAAVSYNSISGNGHYAILPLNGSISLPYGTHSAIFYVITDAGNDELQVLSRNLTGTISVTY